MYVKLLTNNFLSEKAVGKSESKDVHLAVLRVLPEVIRESVDAERHADYRKGEGGKGTEGERRDAGRIVAVNQGKRGGYGAQNEAYMSRSAEKWVRDLCFNELGVCG